MSNLKLTIAAALGLALAGATVAQATSFSALRQAYERPDSIPFPEDNPYTPAKAALGKKLFFDPRLSGSNAMSCASCHNPSFAWGDGLAVGVGAGDNRLGRRTPTILNLAWGELMMWDGRFESLEEQALGPVGADVEMHQDLDSIVGELSAIADYRTSFAEVFPGEGITLDTIAAAIATYERTVVSGWAPFDDWINGDHDAIPASAQRGFELFNGKANCSACHAGWRQTDDSFHDIGLPDSDIGRGAELPMIEKMNHAFKTPTLRNVTERGPYMHDGSLPDLMAVVRHYNDGGVSRPSRSEEIYPLQLSKQEIADLVAFMETLTSQDPPVSLPRLPR